jgi:hypothetical protein
MLPCGLAEALSVSSSLGEPVHRAFEDVAMVVDIGFIRERLQSEMPESSSPVGSLLAEAASIEAQVRPELHRVAGGLRAVASLENPLKIWLYLAVCGASCWEPVLFTPLHPQQHEDADRNECHPDQFVGMDAVAPRKIRNDFVPAVGIEADHDRSKEDRNDGRSSAPHELSVVLLMTETSPHRDRRVEVAAQQHAGRVDDDIAGSEAIGSRSRRMDPGNTSQ